MTAEAAEAALDRAAAYLAAGRPDAALASLGPVLAHDPHDPDALHLQAVALSRLGRHDEAVAAASALVAGRPGHALALRVLGDALLARGDHAQAVGVAAEACRRAPQEAQSHVLMAEALFDSGRPAEALAAAHEAIRRDPQLVAAYDVAGRAELRAWNPRGAEAAFREALRLRPNDPALLNNLGVARQSLGDPRGAAELFAAAGRADPSFELARENTSGMVGNVLWLAAWLPAWVSLQLARRLHDAGHSRAAVAVVVLGVGFGAALTLRRLRGALRQYVINAVRLRLPTRGHVLRLAAAVAVFAAAAVASAQVGYRDRLLTAVVTEAGLLAAFVVFARGWRRRRPPPTTRPAGPAARIAALADAGLGCVVAAGLVLPFWRRPEAGAVLAVSFAVVPLLYVSYVDGLGGSRLRAAFGGAYVVGPDGAQPPGFRRGLLRTVVKALTLPAAFLALAGRRPPHDAVARTAVVRGIGR